MKKSILKSLTALILSVIFMSVTILGCASTSGNGDKVKSKAKALVLDPVEIDYVSIEDGNITYTTLPQFEFMCLLCRIAGVQGFNNYYNGDNSYLDQMDSLLGKYKNHNVVKTMQNFTARGVSGEGFVNLAYHIKPDFGGTTVALNPKPETLNQQWKSIPSAEIISFVKAFHDLAIEANYPRLYTLYRGEFLANAGGLREDCTKYFFDKWNTEFYTAGEGRKVTVNISKANVGLGFYDFAMINDDETGTYLSTFFYNSLYSLSHLYGMAYAQDYVNENWDEIKEPFTKFFREVLKNMSPDNAREIDKMEIIPWHLCGAMAEIFGSMYVADINYEIEDIPGLLDEYIGTAIKVYGEKAGRGVFDLFMNYRADRENYPDFKSLYPKINEFVKTLPDCLN